MDTLKDYVQKFQLAVAAAVNMDRKTVTQSETEAVINFHSSRYCNIILYLMLQIIVFFFLIFH